MGFIVVKIVVRLHKNREKRRGGRGGGWGLVGFVLKLCSGLASLYWGGFGESDGREDRKRWKNVGCPVLKSLTTPL